MSEELKPCPFCGEESAVLDGKSDSCRVRCESCGTEGRPSFFSGDDQDAIDIAEDEARYGWNARSTPKQGEAQTEMVVADLVAALGAMLTQFGMDEDEWSKPTFDQARQAYEYARIVMRPMEPHERHALAAKRALTSGWHERAVALGADGVDEVIRAAEIAKRRGELHTVDGCVSRWTFPNTPSPSVEPGWQPIETAPDTRKCFVVRGFSVQPTPTSMAGYTTDPYCVWRGGDGGFVRWPHDFPPTHWMPLPPAPKEPKP